ncbi:hypothetical protein [Paraburkholderia sp.]|uniref:hypothetical protein n=1 Tax=Paraburkholderia sp. TaxID=1926495 RepID=UPI003D6DB5C4
MFVYLLLVFVVRCSLFVACGSPWQAVLIRASRRRRCPCAGRRLLFFAAAKKSKQKKAAETLPGPFRVMPGMALA